MNASNWLGLCSLLVAAAALYQSLRRDHRGDAAGSARIEAKLDSAVSGIEDIRVEFRTMRETVSGHGARIAALEQDCKNLHHQVDGLIQATGRQG